MMEYSSSLRMIKGQQPIWTRLAALLVEPYNIFAPRQRWDYAFLRDRQATGDHGKLDSGLEALAGCKRSR